MFQKRFIWVRVVTGVLLLAVLVSAGFFIFRAGQASGLAISQSQTAGGQTPAQPAPFALRGHGYPMMHGHFFPHFGLFFLCVAPFLLLFFFGGLFRWMVWGRPWHGHGAHHWHGHPVAGAPGQPPGDVPGQPAQPSAPQQPSSGQPQ